jgi:hypothetical protein
MEADAGGQPTGVDLQNEPPLSISRDGEGYQQLGASAAWERRSAIGLPL